MPKRRIAEMPLQTRRAAKRSEVAEHKTYIKNRSVQLLAMLPDSRADKIAVLDYTKKLVRSIYAQR